MWRAKRPRPPLIRTVSWVNCVKRFLYFLFCGVYTDQKVLDILYATTDGFEVPEEAGDAAVGINGKFI